MDKKLIINSSPAEVEIALLEERKLVEIHRQKSNSSFSVGDIFIGQIKKTMPGLNAAFVDIGHRKDAFLHYTDLGPQIKSLLKYVKGSTSGAINSQLLDNFEKEPDNKKNGKIDKVFHRNQLLLAQILKEPISTKGPRLSCEITIPGRYMVLTPFYETVAVSKKISNSEERKRLKNLAESIKPKKFGLILRTAAEGKKVAELHEELKALELKWKSMFEQLIKYEGPGKLLSELDKTTSILRDMLTDSFDRIVVNDKELYANVKSFLVQNSPGQKNIVSMHRGTRPIFDSYGITKQIKSSFGKTTTMSSGAYIVIEHTEAMHVVDVNSGPKMKKMDQESAAILVNLEAAAEVSRQLRLRDIGGIIIIDFIDMKNPENKRKLYQEMRAHMKSDRAQHTVLQLSRFGLMQITRQRTRPEVKINTAELCASCNGTGKTNPTILLADEIHRDLEYIFNSRPKSKLRLKVHPYIYAYLKQGFPNWQWKWYFKYFNWVKIESDMQFTLDKYKFYDHKNDEIRLN